MIVLFRERGRLYQIYKVQGDTTISISPDSEHKKVCVARDRLNDAIAEKKKAFTNARTGEDHGIS